MEGVVLVSDVYFLMDDLVEYVVKYGIKVII